MRIELVHQIFFWHKNDFDCHRMSFGKRHTFAQVYNSVYKKNSCKNSIKKEFEKQVRFKNALNTRYWWTIHMAKLIQTQQIGRNLCFLLPRIQRIKRICELAILFKLRKLQRRIIMHLWRPGSFLMEREMHVCMQIQSHGAQAGRM
jgi:hypothetical protein